MRWFHHYVTDRRSEELQKLLTDPEFGLKGYAIYFLIKEIMYEKIETYTKKDFVDMTISQWCAELYIKWKVLDRFLSRYSKDLDLEYEVLPNPAPLAKRSKTSLVLRMRSLKALSGLESRMSKNNKNYKNSKNYKNNENSKSFGKYSGIEIISEIGV